jgi:single-stranded-DNA-specific exonuclease
MVIKQRVVVKNVPEFAHLHQVLQRVYSSRGIVELQQLETNLAALLPYHTLKNIDKAALRLEQALREGQRILIIGDFDADGATSTALAVSALQCMGTHLVEFLVPNRFAFGYGLTPGIVEVAKKWRPHLIITVDNGIASIEGVEAANNAGIDVLITDHHLPAEVLPNACVIVNPNQLEDDFPSKSIAGVGVIFYVMLALRSRLKETQWFEQQSIPVPNMAQFLDLVALGTVADVVSLDKNNRILVKQGLNRIRNNQCRPGIKALIEISGRKCAQLRESDLGFSVAPRLNAAGRLDDMSLGINCLLAANSEQASQLAQELDELNVERRKIETEMKDKALSALEKLSYLTQSSNQKLPLALCLVDPSWHQGVVGILAGRLKDKFHRPVIIFALVNEQEMKGSARSIIGLNIRDVLATIDKDFPGLITKFGGHAMAAGLSIHPDGFQQFRDAFVNEVCKHLDPGQCEGEILTDGPLLSEECNLELAKLIHESGPWGQQFPEPLFDNFFEVLDQRLVGQHHLKLTLAHKDTNQPLDAIAFNVDLNQWPNHRARSIRAAYKLDINEYQGRVKLQLVISSLDVAS